MTRAVTNPAAGPQQYLYHRHEPVTINLGDAVLQTGRSHVGIDITRATTLSCYSGRPTPCVTCERERLRNPPSGTTMTDHPSPPAATTVHASRLDPTRRTERPCDRTHRRRNRREVGNARTATHPPRTRQIDHDRYRQSPRDKRTSDPVLPVDAERDLGDGNAGARNPVTRESQ